MVVGFAKTRAAHEVLRMVYKVAVVRARLLQACAFSVAQVLKGIVGKRTAAAYLELASVVNDQQEDLALSITESACAVLRRVYAGVCSQAAAVRTAPVAHVEPDSVVIAPALSERFSNVDTPCILKIFSWNIYKASRHCSSDLAVLKRVLDDGYHEVLALQEISTKTEAAFKELAGTTGFEYFAAEPDEITETSAKSMRNALLLRRGAMRPGFRRIPWNGRAQFKYPPVTLVGNYGRAGDVRIGITSFHTQGASANRDLLEGELARMLGVAEDMAAEADIDVMVMIGDANLQHIQSLCASEVDRTLEARSSSSPEVLIRRVHVQTPHLHERNLEAKGLRPAGVQPGVEWWPKADVCGPWLLIRPDEATLSSGKLADCAFILRRRPVPMAMAGPKAWTWPYLCRGSSVAAHESFGSNLLHSDHKPIEVTWVFR